MKVLFFILLTVVNVTLSVSQDLWKYQQNLVFYESFNPTKHQWPTGDLIFKIKLGMGEYLEQKQGLAKIENGIYNIRSLSNKECSINNSLIEASKINYDLEIDLNKINCESFSILFNGTEINVQAKTTTFLINDTKSILINPQIENSLKVIRIKDSCKSYINDKLIYEHHNVNVNYNLEIKVKNGSLQLNQVKLYQLLPVSTEEKINLYVSAELKKWLEQGKYEKTLEFNTRTSAENIEQQKKEFRKKIINQMASGSLKCHLITNTYNPDEEYFTLFFQNRDSLFVHIPVDNAKAINDNFCLFDFKNAQYDFLDNEFHITETQLINKQNGKTYFAYNTVAQAQHYNKERYRDINDVFDEYTVHQLESAKNYLLVIGVQDYDDPSLNDLNNPVNDGKKLISTLTEGYTFYTENIFFLENPTRSDIVTQLDFLSKKINQEDNLLIFYAGHGVWDQTLEKGYWLPKDASKENRANWFSNSLLRDYLSGINSKHTLLVSDACFSGGIFKTREAFNIQKAIEELYKLPSRKAMTSGAMNTVPDNSVFIEYLTKRLKENQNKTLSAEQLFSSFRIAVINNSPNSQVPLYGDIKETGDEGGDFIFVRK